jgi:hypothetical protein
MAVDMCEPLLSFVYRLRTPHDHMAGAAAGYCCKATISKHHTMLIGPPRSLRMPSPITNTSLFFRGGYGTRNSYSFREFPIYAVYASTGELVNMLRVKTERQENRKTIDRQPDLTYLLLLIASLRSSIICDVSLHVVYMEPGGPTNLDNRDHPISCQSFNRVLGTIQHIGYF